MRSLGVEQHGQVLQFATGSSSSPAAGFANLMGFSNRIHRFRLSNASAEPERLPTASTCFNTIKLPLYESEAQLRDKLLLAVEEAATTGFDENAVAE